MKKQRDLYHVSLKLLLKNSDGKILALKAQSDGSMKGFYDVPGGRIDTDEFTAPFSEILKREVIEEVGDLVKFELTSDKPVAVSRHNIPKEISKLSEDRHILQIFFEAKYLGGDIKISDEHLSAIWLDLKEIDLATYFTAGILEGVRMYMR